MFPYNLGMVNTLSFRSLNIYFIRMCKRIKTTNTGLAQIMTKTIMTGTHNTETSNTETSITGTMMTMSLVVIG